MIDAICDICGRQTCEPHVLELKKYDPYDKGYSHKIILCKDCANIMKKEIELLKVIRTTKPASYAEISYREAAIEEAFEDIAKLGLMRG